MQTRGTVILGSPFPRRPDTLSRSVHRSPRQGRDWDPQGRVGSTAGPTLKPGLQLRSHQRQAGGKLGAGWWWSVGSEQGSPQQTQVSFHCVYFGCTMRLAGS